MKASNRFYTPTRMSVLSLIIMTTIILTLFAGSVALAQDVADRASPNVKVSNIKSETKAAPASAREAAPTAPARVNSAQASIVQDAPGINGASAYGFSTATNGTFTDMSSGTTQLVGAGADDTASAITNIGFDFFFQGTRYTQFSASSNGYIRLGGTAVSTTQYTLGTAAVPLITAYGSDMIVSTTGKVHYKVTGSAPNRVLTVEFLNITIIYDGIGTSADGTYQVRLYESTGVIEFVYGAMNRNTGTGFGGANNPQYVGFSLNSTADTFATVTTSTNTVSTTGTPASNLPTNGAAIPNLNTPTNGAHRVYTFTPPVPTAPTNLTFTGVTPVAMTLNWTDAPDESGYAIYRSTDGTNYSLFGTAAQNATSFNATGLSPSTTYFWQVYSNSDGALSATALSGSQATAAPGVVTSTAVGGLWSSTATWAGGVVPTATDDVTIANGATVIIDTAAVALDVTVGQGASGILQFDATTARTLTVGQNVTIASGGTFQSGLTGTITTHVLSVGGNLTNNGVLDFSTNANTAGAGITFTGAANNTFSGTGATTDIRTMTINKGTSNANIIEMSPSNFTVQGTTTDGTPMAFLTLTNGTLKVSGTFTLAGRVFTTAGYTIAATAGFWLNNPNFTVAGQNGSPTEAGLLRISQGTFNIGTSSGNSMGFSTGATVTVEGGAVNATGRFGVASATNTITYTQSGGTITVCTIGNTSATLGSFDLGTGVGSVINISGGTVVVQLAASAIDYRYDAGGSLSGLTGGTVQFGNASSGAAKSFSARGVAFNYVVNTTSAGHTVNLSTTLVNWNHVAFGINVGTGGTFGCGNSIFFIEGNVVNNGILTATSASVRLYNAASSAQTYSGSGTFTAPVTSFELDNANGLTITTTNQIPTARVILFSGSVTGANKITLGNGGSTTGTVQIGNTTTPTAAGSFDGPMTFNLGTGGEVISYLRTTTNRNTGGEINPARSLTTLNVDPNGVNVNLVGNLTVTGTTTITTGNFVIGANTLTLTNAIAGATPTGLMGDATSSLTLNGTTASNVPSSITALNNLTLNNSGGSTLQANLTVNSLNLTSGVLTIGARILGINGAITVGTGSLTGGATSEIDIGGSGSAVTLPAVTGGLNNLIVNRDGGLNLGAPLTLASNLVLSNGIVNNSSNNVTMGNGSQIRRDLGSISVAPNFVGNYDVYYANAVPNLVTGPEIPVSTTALRNLKVDNLNGITLGSSPTVNLGLNLNGGNIVTGGNTLTIASSGTVIRASGFIEGNLRKIYVGAICNTFEVGTGSIYSPATLCATALSGGSNSATVTANSGFLTSAPTRNKSQRPINLSGATRSWTVTSSGVYKGSLAFTYDAGDVTGNEALYRIIRKNPNDQRFLLTDGSTDNVNEATHTAATVNTVAFGSVSKWTVAPPTDYNVVVGQPRPFETFDFKGNDSKTDVAVWNGGSGYWTIINSSNNAQTVSDPWGSTALGDVLVPGDYDGDGITDLTVWRPSEGNFYLVSSSTGLASAKGWGTTGDIPVPADYDGDGKTDYAIFRPSEGNWYIINSATNTVTLKNWGASTDKLVPADYDGDGKVDIAIFRPSEGNWYIINSATNTVTLRNWGASDDRLMPGDYDGDGKTDVAVWRPSEGNWYISNSSDGSTTVKGWGVSGDVLVPGDYDRDGRTDIGIWRPSEGNWYIIRSSDGGATTYLGSDGDIPVITVPN